MEIRIYNRDMEFQGIIENQRSLLWNRQYNETGDFELHCPITPYNVSLLKRGNLVWKKGAVDAGIIEDLHIQEDSEGNEIAVKGRFLPSYYDRRLIKEICNYQNFTCEAIMKNLALIAYGYFSNLILIDESRDLPGRMSLQVTYKNALSCIQKVAKQAQFGFRVVPNFNAKTMTFVVYQGVDRSMAQSDRARVIFSEGYNNLSSASHDENDQVYRNVCFVGGRGTGPSRQYVAVGDTDVTGFDRREIFVNGSDISPDNLTDDEYLEALKQRGLDKLAENALYNSIECEAIPYGNFEYGTDYDLGDIVTIKKESWDIGENLRITGITEVYENGTQTIQPTFGEPVPVTANWNEE